MININKFKDKNDRIVILSEFGGYSYIEQGHAITDKLYGYKKFTDKVLMNEKLMELYKDMVLDNIPRGLSGCIYTQLSDVEDECNGLFTMDRQVTKVDTRKIKKMNEKLVRSLNK